MRADTQSAVMLAVGRCIRGHRFAEMLSVRPSQFSGDGFPLPPVSDVLSHMPATTSLQERYIFLLKNEVAHRRMHGSGGSPVVPSGCNAVPSDCTLSPVLTRVYVCVLVDNQVFSVITQQPAMAPQLPCAPWSLQLQGISHYRRSFAFWQCLRRL